MLPPDVAPALEAALREAVPGGTMLQLYLAAADDTLVCAAAVGAGGDGPDLALVAEALTDTPRTLDLSGYASADAGLMARVPARGIGVSWPARVPLPRGALLLLADAPPADAHAVVVSLAAQVARALAAPERPSAAGPPPEGGLLAALLRQTAHDLRTPLTALAGYADLLAAEPSAAAVAEASAVLRRAAARLSGTVDGLAALALLPPDAAVGAVRGRTLVQPGSIAEAVVAAHRAAAVSRRTTLSVAVPLPDAPVLLDAALFERLLRVLVGAAVVATADGRVDGRLTGDGTELVFDLRAAPAGAASPPITALVGHLVEALDGTVGSGPGGDAWRWTVRLPGRAAPVIELAPAGEEPVVAEVAAPR